ncbi:hypothetical protein Mp_3g01220 [Marchantia polymorpha subsp. ruderalis]|uniref:Uncharacterized protein n=2 Tax=Marchantia polymorpha TaxID=3197 RepID=A0AAF6AW88_MARPO|nr:hypothetical protein MARPO_0007s0116 [Marchantia polymorpha]BBN04022.1 hypothetical protein Mp_3g01220 [Marchantia polymorpha subsp. ruderalis]|eukprot:PTQ47709.1 hypothetical protein MARPO_0007s0116 [Marchantia polymorpha]
MSSPYSSCLRLSVRLICLPPSPLALPSPPLPPPSPRLPLAAGLFHDAAFPRPLRRAPPSLRLPSHRKPETGPGHVTPARALELSRSPAARSYPSVLRQQRRPPERPPARPSVCLSVCPSVYLSVCPAVRRLAAAYRPVGARTIATVIRSRAGQAGGAFDRGRIQGSETSSSFDSFRH